VTRTAITPPGAGNEIAAAVTALTRKAEDALRPLVQPDELCALVGFPDYANVGDSAIWLGECRLLERLGARIAYVSDERNFNPRELVQCIGPGPVFIQGGGNLGDIWPHHQVFRESVLRALPGSPVIQLPQSIHFRASSRLAHARAAFQPHPRFKLLVRDRSSLELAQAEFQAAQPELCPDMALGLGLLPRPGPARCDVVTLARSDDELVAGAGARDVPAPWPVFDWAREGSLTKVLRRALRPLLRHAPFASRRADVYDRLARHRLAAGLHLLGRGRVVVTDRLHGHVLSLLLGIPHVVLDNSYGKLFGFLEAWTGHIPLVRHAVTPAEARAEALRLLGVR
jgi:pyruvyl transferase EpsO